jgi:hypothetical protein
VKRGQAADGVREGPGEPVGHRLGGCDGSTRLPRVRTVMARYDRMDLADASIVVMSELHTRCQVLTVDRKDFSVYRRNERQVIDFVAPPKG